MKKRRKYRPIFSLEETLKSEEGIQQRQQFPISDPTKEKTKDHQPLAGFIPSHPIFWAPKKSSLCAINHRLLDSTVTIILRWVESPPLSGSVGCWWVSPSKARVICMYSPRRRFRHLLPASLFFGVWCILWIVWSMFTRLHLSFWIQNVACLLFPGFSLLLPRPAAACIACYHCTVNAPLLEINRRCWYMYQRQWRINSRTHDIEAKSRDSQLLVVYLFLCWYFVAFVKKKT